MTTKVVAIANQKGGVGKTTTSLQLVFNLLAKGKRVLCIDFDGQGNLSSRLAYETDEGEPLSLGTRTVELYREDDFELNPTICPSGAHLIRSEKNDPDLFGAESYSGDITLLPKMHISTISANYDYIVIDCPPSLGNNLVSALTMATHVATVVKVTGFAIDGAEGLIRTILGLQGGYNPDLKNLGLIINMQDSSITHKKAAEEIKADLGSLVFDNVIRYRTPIDTATSLGIPVNELPYAHVAAREIERVLDEIIQRANS